MVKTKAEVLPALSDEAVRMRFYGACTMSFVEMVEYLLPRIQDEQVIKTGIKMAMANGGRDIVEFLIPLAPTLCMADFDERCFESPLKYRLPGREDFIVSMEYIEDEMLAFVTEKLLHHHLPIASAPMKVTKRL